jgi:hypothetical protein
VATEEEEEGGESVWLAAGARRQGLLYAVRGEAIMAEGIYSGGAGRFEAWCGGRRVLVGGAW